MRIGKSGQAILAARKVLAQRTLVVCPAIAVAQWRAEWWRWWPQAGIAPTVVSYDRLRLNAEGILSQDYDLAIVDECHFAKNPTAQRTKLIYGKGGVGHVAKRMWVLSGTPAPKHAGELWAMLYAFGATALSYAAFVNRYCTINRFTLKITGTKEKTIPELKALLAKVMLRRTRKDVAPDMPGIAYEFLSIDPAGKPDYKAPAGLSDSQLLSWLEAHASADREDRQAVAQAKAPALAEEIEAAIHSRLYAQTVVFGWHVEPLRWLSQRLNGGGIRAAIITGATTTKERERIQADFRQGNIKVIAANILAAGTAIDLSSASHGYFLELDWVPGNNEQAANRLVSMEKKEPVTFDVVTMPGTTDDRVQRVLLTRASQLRRLY